MGIAMEAGNAPIPITFEFLAALRINIQLMLKFALFPLTKHQLRSTVTKMMNPKTSTSIARHYRYSMATMNFLLSLPQDILKATSVNFLRKNTAVNVLYYQKLDQKIDGFPFF